ncbi:MAG: DNA alkylation repair protein [Candidatus Bathyarchaeota archaeon]|nr:MAG: DNA alkylation repair protein [Candidatus Bathyarchaeota archaeon]
MEDMIRAEIRDRLKKYADLKERKKRTRWEKASHERPKLYGVPTPVVRKLSSEFFRKVKKKPKHEILQLSNDLLRSGYSEERTIAFDWAFRLRRKFERLDFQLLETWLTEHVQGWGACDDFCTHALGAFLYKFPAFIPKTRDWTRSENRWVRRASAVCLIYSARRKVHLEDVFRTADALLTDHDVMVQKGYGWMLKEASNHYPKEVFNYVMTKKKGMPRTALRYAIEKLSLEYRAEAMKRE